MWGKDIEETSGKKKEGRGGKKIYMKSPWASA